MKLVVAFVASLSAFAGRSAAAVGVTGKAPGFASETTGGGDAPGEIPSDIKQLAEWLSDKKARTIVLDKEYDFIGSEGKTTEDGCRPPANHCAGNGGQDSLNGPNWCTQDNKPVVKVTFDEAGTNSINLGPNKSIVGVGNKGVIRGKGLRLANGASNIIIQNIHITELNPQYIWGGDAIILEEADLIWIDHVKISLTGRQQFVSRGKAANRISITNNEFDGVTSWSNTCDNHHYWTVFFNGEADLVTFQGNWIHDTSGRSPKLASGILLHAVNNYWADNSGHAFEIGPGAVILAEGNMFSNVKKPIEENEGALFSPSTLSTDCQAVLGRACQPNTLEKSGDFTGSDTSVLEKFKGKTLVEALEPSANIALTAGVGKLEGGGGGYETGNGSGTGSGSGTGTGGGGKGKAPVKEQPETPGYEQPCDL